MFKFSLILFCIESNGYGQEFQNGSRWISASNGLRMRDMPDLNGKKLDVIPYGDRVTILVEKDEVLDLGGTYGKWTKVKWGGTVGWVYGGFLIGLHPDSAKSSLDIDDYTALNNLYSNKWDADISFCRVELDGHGFTLNKDGSIREGEFEYDLTKSYQYEKGISIKVNQGYEWGGTVYEFGSGMYTVEEIFELAIVMYDKKYQQYLDTNNNELVLPVSNENWSRENPDSHHLEYFQSKIKEGTFKSFRIEEDDGCSFWWFFEFDEGLIRFGNGNGC
ncbi:MAG: SH3 domain-containing protein [Cytophagales bacterium]|nr:SH3 domain-containing protein [Cytophagales bacterium]